MGRKINICGGIVALCAASQFPEYSQQYVQRLGGAVDELRLEAAKFDASAAEVGMDRAAALDSMVGSAFVEKRQADNRDMFARLGRLEAHYAVLKDASALARLRAISAFDDSRIAARAWDDFKPAVPLTRDGAVFSAIGFFGGFLALMGLGIMARLFWRGRGRKPAGETDVLEDQVVEEPAIKSEGRREPPLRAEQKKPSQFVVVRRGKTRLPAYDEKPDHGPVLELRKANP